MTRRNSFLASLLGTAMVITVASPQVLAKEKSLTLMQLGDVHGHMHEHTEIFPDGRIDGDSGGIAKLTTLIKDVRGEVGEENSLLLAIGDTTHGSAEMLFSLGELIVPWLNDIGIDAFTPGNWDFGWGPRVYKQRFVPDDTTTGLAPNNRTTIAWLYNDPDPASGKNCNVGGPPLPYSQCHLIKANFDTVAMNVYNFAEVAGLSNPAQPLGPPVHLHDGKTYVIKEANGIKVGVLGLTSDVVPQQAQAFNTGFRFTMGYKEMPANIAAAKADGAELIVVLSELGLAKNVQMVKEFPEIDVMFSGHTHERTPEAIVIEHVDNTISIVTESGEDSFLGRLDLKLTGNGKINTYEWTLIEADHRVGGDDDVDDMVDAALEPFEDGAECHTFGVNAFPYGSGHTLCDTFDTVIGHTDVTIQRFDALEDISNNVMVDAFLDLAKFLGVNDSKLNPLTDANTLSTTNGFRFDIVIPGDGETLANTTTPASGDITIGDLYDYYPIGAATGLAEYTGGRLKLHWEGILNNVFDPNPYRQRGGWFLGFTNNMHFDLQLNDDYPLSISYGKRIANVTVDDVKVDDSKIYTLASCYPHGNPTDEVCRTAGATNLRFITALQESTGPTDIFGNRQLDMSGSFMVVEPVVKEDQLPVFDPAGPTRMPPRPIFRKVAPDNFVHPVDALRRYLGPGPTVFNHVVTESADGLGRVEVVGAEMDDPRRGVPVSEFGGPGIVQPTQGVGPEWLKREFVK